MSINPEKDAIRVEARKREIMDAAFSVFTERSIDKVTMNDVAAAAGIGVATVYRHFSTKPALVLAVAAKAWGDYAEANYQQLPGTDSRSAAQVYEFFLDSFIDLYRNHQDLLRFNQMFNIYVRAEGITGDQLKPYNDMIGTLAERFHHMYLLAEKNGTLRTDVPEQEMFSATLHLMLAASTRYAVGLVYDAGIDPERELELLKRMLIREFVTLPA